MTQFRLPDLGEGLQEAEIVTWHIGPGDHVVADQPLVAVETEKAVVEIPSPRSGHIKALLAKVGERVKVGAPLVEFEEGAHADTGAIVGELSQKPPSPMSPVSTTLAPLAAPAAAAAPAVRARARELGVDLAAIIGSGPGGAITRSDVERAAQASTGGDGKPLSAVRRAMAQAMARSRDEVTPATIYDDADVDHWPADAEVTLLLARAIAAAVAIVPVLNAAFDGARLALRSNSTVDLGVAVDTQDGLFVPILRDVGGRDIAALRGELARLVERVRSRTIELTDMRWPTITLSNFGGLGGRYAALSIVPPQVAILGAGRIGPYPVVRDAQIAIRKSLPLSLTFDHRAVTGGEAARFLHAVKQALETSGS